MKKLQLKALSLGAKELLSRDQLKNILGGGSDTGSGSEPGGGSNACNYCKIAGVTSHGWGPCSQAVGCDEGTCVDYECE